MQPSNKCFFEDKLDQFVVRRLSDLDRSYFVFLVKIDEINGYDCFLKNGETEIYRRIEHSDDPDMLLHFCYVGFTFFLHFRSHAIQS